MSADLMVTGAAAVAVGAAARSTWSPCGLSMLSTITPFGERARGHRYWATATWFMLGALAGGLTLGLPVAGLADLLHLAGPRAGSATAVMAIAALVAALGAGVDSGILGPVLPLIRRQVDDGWVSRYRPWVYGAGFGWQIGTGLATYLMTAAVVVVAALAALTASPLAALAICAGFGTARGLTVLLPAAATTPDRLRRLHARVERLGKPVRRAVIGAQAGVALILGWAAILPHARPAAPVAVVLACAGATVAVMASALLPDRAAACAAPIPAGRPTPVA